jgi:uncharacterized caspase-like protein
VPEQPRDYAVVIGINHYPDYSPLQGAINDANGFYEWLIDREHGGGLPARHVKKVISTRKQPQHDRTDNALNYITDLAEKAGGGRRLYFYFSGHGLAITSDPESVALCLCDYSRKNRNSALNSGIYLNYMKRCAPFSEIVVLLDCCRDRSVEVAGLPPKRHPCATPQETAGSTRTFVAFASDLEKSSYEAEVQEGDDSKIVHGYFTRALLAALRGDAASPQGGVPARKLAGFLEAEVPRIADQRQRARVFNLLSDDPEALFGSATPARINLHVTFTAARDGEIELIGPHADVIAVHDVAAGPWELGLDRGLYALKERQTDKELLFRFEPGAEVRRVEF